MTTLLRIVQLVCQENGFCDQIAALPHVELQLDLFLIDLYALPLRHVVFKNQMHVVQGLLQCSVNNEGNPWSRSMHLGKNYSDTEMCQAMDMAIQTNNRKLLQVLMECGPRFALCYRSGRISNNSNARSGFCFHPFDRAAYHGQQSILQWLYDFDQGYYTQSALVEAAARGCLEIVQFLVNKELTQQAGQAVFAAAENGHFEVIKLLFLQCVFEYSMTWLIAKALRCGHLRLAAWLERFERQKCPSIRRFDLIRKSLHLLMKSGDFLKTLASAETPLEEIQWLVEDFRSLPMRLLKEVFLLACEAGELTKVMWLFARLPSPLKPVEWLSDRFRLVKCSNQMLVKAMQSACAHGHLHVVKFLLHKGVQHDCLEMAIANGHVELAQYLQKESRLLHYPTLSDKRVRQCLQVAVCRGHTAILTHFDTGNNYKVNYPPQAWQLAATSGNSEMLEFLFKNGSCDLTVYMDALETGLFLGHLQVVACVLSAWAAKWEASCTATRAQMSQMLVTLTQKVLQGVESATNVDMEGIYMVLSPPLPSWVTLTDWFVPAAIRSAVRQKHLRLIRLFHCRQVRGFDPEIMDLAARVGSLSIVRFLHENRSEGCSTDAMDHAAAGGFLHIVKYLHANREEGCTFRALSYASTNGHWQIIRFLGQAYPHLPLRGCLDQAVTFGHLRTVQELLNTVHHGEEHASSVQELLWRACERRHVGIVQWLLEKFTNQSKRRGSTRERENHERIDCCQVLQHVLATLSDTPGDDYPLAQRIVFVLEQHLDP